MVKSLKFDQGGKHFHKDLIQRLSCNKARVLFWNLSGVVV